MILVRAVCDNICVSQVLENFYLLEEVRKFTLIKTKGDIYEDLYITCFSSIPEAG